MNFAELCALHDFIIAAGYRLLDEDGNVPFDSDSARRYQLCFYASMIVLDRIMGGALLS